MPADLAADAGRSLQRQAAILEAVRLAAERFLDRSTSWEQHLPEVLASLARATGTSRVYLFENLRDTGDEVWSTQRFEWSAPGVRSIADVPILLDLPMVATGFRRWVQLFRRGEIVHGLRSDFPLEEQAQLTEDETLSIAVVPIMVDGAWWGMLGFDECAYERVWGAGELNGLRAAASTVAAAIRASRDDAERAAVRDLLERRVGALSAVARTVTVDQPLRATLDEVCRIAVEATDAVAASVTVVDPDLGQRRLWGWHGLTDGYVEALEGLWAEDGGNLGREVLETQAWSWLPDGRAAVLAAPDYAPLHPHVAEMEFAGTLSLPLDALGRNLGAVSIAYGGSAEPDEGERSFLRAIADQAAAAVENARLFGAAQRGAALEERQRLARDLHDSVSQALYGIALGARTARTLAERDPGAVAAPLDYVLNLAEAGLAEMRSLIFELRPDALASDGLVDALARQAHAVTARHGVQVTADLPEEPDIALDRKEALYRVAQEALHNVAKHARASTATLALEVQEDAVRLVVEDDGVGFDTTGSFPGHLGLVSMRERVEAVGGACTLTSTPGQGTRLCVEVPATAS